MAFEFNWAQPKLDLQMKGPKAPALQQPQHSQSFYDYMDAQQLSNGFNPTNDMKNWLQQGNEYKAMQEQQEQAMQQQEQTMQEQAAAKQQQVDSIKSRIQELESQIAANQAKLKNWSTPAGEIAALEARKINAADPTSIWRWKIDRDEARRIADMEKDKTKQLTSANAMYEIQNDLDSIVVDDKMDSATQKAYLGKLAGLKTLAQKNGLPTDSIDAKIKEVKGETETSTAKGPEGTEYEGTSREQWDNEAEELLNKPDLTQGDIMKFKQKNPNISNEVRQKLEAKHAQIIEADKNKAYEKKWKSYLADYEKEHGKVSDAFAKTLRRIYDKQNKKG